MSDVVSTASVYLGRDVVNAPSVKRAIARRSQERQDCQEISAWLLNHFFRYAIGNFIADPPYLQLVTNIDQVKRLYAPDAVPEWVIARLSRLGVSSDSQSSQSESLWWLEPSNPQLIAVEARLLEFLHARLTSNQKGKLARINCLQALVQSAADHAVFEAKANAGWREHQPLAVFTRMNTGLGRFVELKSTGPLLRAEMAYESQMMRHCLGQFAQRRALKGGYGEHYASECEAGRLRLFSFRTGRHQPHITISAKLASSGLWSIDQIKGKQNRPPVLKYRNVIKDFLNTLDTDESTPDDAVAIGLLRTRENWQTVADIVDPIDQAKIAHQYPVLIRQFTKPEPLVQWIVAGSHPKYLEGLVLAPEVTRALSDKVK